jgi:hypothetical protein
LSNANQEKVRQLANVHWVLPVSPRFGNKNTWEENPHPFPYVRMLARAQITYNVIEDLDKVNLATTALTYERVDPPEGSPGQADLIEKRPGKMVIHTQSATRQLLAVSESWHPGWRVWIDGLEAPVLRINGDFQGCAIDAGNHEVRFSFEPMGIVIGRRITLASLVVLTAACFALRYLNTRGGSGKGA